MGICEGVGEGGIARGERRFINGSPIVVYIGDWMQEKIEELIAQQDIAMELVERLKDTNPSTSEYYRGKVAGYNDAIILIQKLVSCQT